MVEQVMRGFERAQQQGRAISAVTERRRKRVCELMQKWRREFGYTPAAQGRTQPRERRLKLDLTEELRRRTKAEGRLKKERAAQGPWREMVELMEAERDEAREELEEMRRERDEARAEVSTARYLKACFFSSKLN